MSVEKDEVLRLNPIARPILQGLYDSESPLHKLLGLHFILKAIWINVVDHWKSRIKQGDDHNLSLAKVRKSPMVESDQVVKFPKPKKIKINMMPFVMERNFKDTKLPKYLKRYWEQIIQHCITCDELGKIGYLTIQESYVEEGASQRRPGIHTESPGVTLLKDSKGVLHHRYFGWGRGDGDLYNVLELTGGIYMVSNVNNSCRVWDCEILRPEADDALDIVGKHGDIEHLREFLPSTSQVMEANVLYWITDRTPHESLPLSKGTYRQFFRLVTSNVGAWFEDHSTKNPSGVVPDPNITKIIKGSKFDGICCIVDP